MTHLHKIAVIIPCYNYAKFVARAIHSVLDQNNSECEILVIDDGSTDESWDIIHNTGVPALRVSNGGALKACLTGLDNTTAPFVLFLDADDELKPGSIAKIIKLIDPGVAKIQFALTRVDADGKYVGPAAPAIDDYRDSHKTIERILKGGTYRSPPTSGNVFRRDVCEILRQVDYDKFVDGAILYIAPFMGDIISVSEELGSYRIHGRNASQVGSKIVAQSIEKELDRFKGQMTHLQSFIRSKTNYTDIFDIDDTFVVRERDIYLKVATGIRPKVNSLQRLFVKLFKQDEMTNKNKLALALVFLLIALLPRNRAKNVLSYRLSSGSRSIIGLVKAI